MQAQQQAQMNQILRPLIEGYQERMQSYKKKFDALQALSKKVGSEYTQLVQKVHENELVKKEIDILEDDSKIFKQVGPALIPQTKEDAASNVNSRLELLTNNMKKKENELTKAKTEMIKIQQDIQKSELEFKRVIQNMTQPQQK